MKDKKVKIIYIFSLDHSGSTFIDYLLSCHKKIMGLGEVFSVFHEIKSSSERTRSVCSCGYTMEKCPFWSLYQNLNNISDFDKYKRLIKNIKKEEFGTIVDSTKRFDHLETLKELEEKDLINLKVLFLVRDPRGWANSKKELGKKHRKEMRLQGKLKFRTRIRVKERIGFGYFYFLTTWYKRNKKILNFLEKNNYAFMKINYEELCFNSNLLLKDIFSFVGLDNNDFNFENKPNTHIAYGNRMKKSKEKRQSIKYDSNWFYNFWLNFSFAIFWVFFKDWKKFL